MKKTILTSVLIMLSCAAFAAVDTSTIDNATTIDNAKKAYQTAADNVINEYTTKVDKDEIDSARQKVTENINAVTEEAKNGTLSETIDKAEKSGSGDGVLSEEDSKAKIAELQENADAMKEKEQSLANRLVSGASMGAMGIGGMQLASAAAEQSADAAAEQDMSAYLATFKCDYGQGMTINGGDSNITLPGANTLLPLYNEYTTLAADLKVRKEALGMTPGIESEVILDAATSGLYDNVGTGVTDGAFASVSRALMNTTGADAAEWNAQKAETAQQLKTGAITAGAGALVGIVGNVLINEVGDKTKEMSDEIIAKYDAKRQAIREELKPVENASRQEALDEGEDTEEGKENPDKTGCENSKGTWNSTNNSCKCPPDKPYWDERNGTCSQCASETPYWDGSKCTACDDTKPYWDGTKCAACPNDTPKWNSETRKCEACPTGQTWKNGECETQTLVPGTLTNNNPDISLFTSSMFASGGYTLKENEEFLNEVISKIKENDKNNEIKTIVLVAHTDADKVLTWRPICTENKICNNTDLSEARAKAVQGYLEKNWGSTPPTIEIKAQGDKCANKDDEKVNSELKELHRRVDVYLLYDRQGSENIGNECISDDKLLDGTNE